MTKPPHQQPALERECSEVLQQWEDWSEIPMLVLSFAWLGLFVIELVWGLTPILSAIGTTIWIAFTLRLYHRSDPRSAQAYLHQTPVRFVD